ncbi:type II secretion system F family protein [Micromonospora sp. MS34]|uniref:type II secretion system F family protein n=1 Tax=Micromonospora sp. MS34 TaxID=3385971 RepID=UPI0039A180EC
MSRQLVVAACLAVAALPVVTAGGSEGRPVRRLRRLARPSTTKRARPTWWPVPAGGPARPSWWPDRIRLGSGLAAVATLVLVGGWPGLFAGVLAGVVADRLLRRFEPRAARARRLREAADLPLAADLLAAALRAGAPVDRSVLAVAEALGGPLADRLGRVGRTLELGGTASESWAHLHPVCGAERLAAAAIRSSDSGAALAGALTRLADDLRSDRATAAEAAARRAGVLIVLPLGLCFLPAFILAGLVPVIVAVLGDVL